MLLPHLVGVVVERIQQTASGVLMWARIKAQDGTVSAVLRQAMSPVHSRYDRGLADLSSAAMTAIPCEG